MKTLKIIIRIIVFPLWALLGLTAVLRLWFLYCYHFIKYGGEAITYTHKNEPQRISDIVDKLLKTE